MLQQSARSEVIEHRCVKHLRSDPDPDPDPDPDILTLTLT